MVFGAHRSMGGRAGTAALADAETSRFRAFTPCKVLCQSSLPKLFEGPGASPTAGSERKLTLPNPMRQFDPSKRADALWKLLNPVIEAQRRMSALVMGSRAATLS